MTRNVGESRTNASSLPPPSAEPTVLVPLDGTTHALVALPVARVLAELAHVTLHVVHVAEPVLPARELLEKLGLTPAQLHGSVLDQTTGPPAEGILRAAREWQSRYIVMCTHTGLMQLHGGLGPVAEAVLCEAPCPVVLVRPTRGLRPWTLRQILLPHDGTPATAIATHQALDLAEQAGAQVIVLHVAAPHPEPTPEQGAIAGPRYLDQPQHEWPAWVDEFLTRMRALGHAPETLALRVLLGKGEPGAEIVRVAESQQADLIVLAWRGYLEAARAATVKAVIAAAPCPVLILRVSG